MKHYVDRTSPKGMDFIGTCRLCGKPNLKIYAALEDCENVRGLTAEQALVEAIVGDQTTPSEGVQMTDLVKRLRLDGLPNSIKEEAAARIEALEAALRAIADTDVDNPLYACETMQIRACAALDQKC